MKSLKLACVIVTVILSTSRAQAAVLSGPITNPANNHKYYLLSQNDWTSSESEAVGLGGHLATINDSAENSWVTSTFSRFAGTSRALWIGLNDVAVEGTFAWSSGEPLGYTNWGPASGGPPEPNNTGGVEDWVHIFPANESRFPKWNDAPNQSNAFGYVFHGVVEVPEPSSCLLFLLGFCGVFVHRRRAL